MLAWLLLFPHHAEKKGSTSRVYIAGPFCVAMARATLQFPTLATALAFIAAMLTVNSPALATAQSPGPVPPVEVNALHALYNATQGPLWTQSQGWVGDTDPCAGQWFGVFCEATNHVTQLYVLLLRQSNLLSSDNICMFTTPARLRSHTHAGPTHKHTHTSTHTHTRTVSHKHTQQQHTHAHTTHTHSVTHAHTHARTQTRTRTRTHTRTHKPSSSRCHRPCLPPSISTLNNNNLVGYIPEELSSLLEVWVL